MPVRFRPSVPNMKYIIDIDNTICYTFTGDYPNSKPIGYNIDKINRLYKEGHHITYWTARGSNSGIDWAELTKTQLDTWGCLYHELKLGKPVYDVWIDDKAINARDYFT